MNTEWYQWIKDAEAPYKSNDLKLCRYSSGLLAQI